MMPSHCPIQLRQSLSCLPEISKCINRSINIILYLPDSLISRNHLSHFSFVHNTLYMLGAQLIEITTICLVLCARNHISYFYRNIKHQPLKYRRTPKATTATRGQVRIQAHIYSTPELLSFHGHCSAFEWRKTE